MLEAASVEGESVMMDRDDVFVELALFVGVVVWRYVVLHVAAPAAAAVGVVFVLLCEVTMGPCLQI